MRCIRDEQGFVWIGTKSGFGKFDGHELNRYKHRQTTRLASPQPDLSDCRRQATQHLGTDWKRCAVYQQQATTTFHGRTEEYHHVIPSALSRTGISLAARTGLHKYSYNDSFRLLQYFNVNSFKINALSMWDSKTLLCLPVVGQAYTS